MSYWAPRSAMGSRFSPSRGHLSISPAVTTNHRGPFTLLNRQHAMNGVGFSPRPRHRPRESTQEKDADGAAKFAGLTSGGYTPMSTDVSSSARIRYSNGSAARRANIGRTRDLSAASSYRGH